MRMYDIIDKKRRGEELSESELEFFIKGYVSGDIPDYQASALLMAICFAGMTAGETALLTQLMAASGDVLDLSAFGDLTVDKHSTGGVGDKTTLIISPILAALGCTVAKLSGRGLGHTGGTIDKLESVTGLRTDLDPREFTDIVKKCGVCVSSAGKNIVPADKKLYALRDVTATVSCIPLISSSIMSKKLAGGAKTIVLDVKTGNGAFIKTLEDSRALAKGMVDIAKLSGRNASAVITDMSRPLGRNIGNALEVMEAAELLQGIDPEPDLREVCVTLATEMYSLATNTPKTDSRQKVEQVLNNGKAYEKFLEWISLQGGDVTLLAQNSDFCSAKYKSIVCAPKTGYISSVNALELGVSAMMLGAGRATKEDAVDPKAGITLLADFGSFVTEGAPIATLLSDTVSDHAAVTQRLLSAVEITPEPPKESPLIYEIIF